ncbi:tripartite tricarboxylate transporter substrate binding protein [Aidingimonas halophila]|uniref:Tripartite-type tricarboxylate transporter, receptor component TctC n=1 Tax=Aidingimonas halophila TaxID=574349 RepID=A0A1H3DGD1_9GAMM|nr:tripartite tricarboxylate transporter substrate binding protein [Aidingimonas halophila]GHC29927.1 ABC transporter substrate-binding protein [Aidingimonas halophila]SDX65390.1 Tripartite-type tricarboxylate transporter, receptor component TctC [Aidingimonas halophila]
MKRTLALSLITPLAFTATGVLAESNYPNQDITIIVPYSAGGSGDTVSRIIADPLSDELGVDVNVVNRPGAGGEVGITEMANADPDGYTVGVFGYPDNFVVENTRDVDFNSDDDLEFLAQFDSTPMGIFAKPNAAYDDLDSLREYASDNPNALVIGESGALGLLSALAFESNLDVELTEIRYDGGGDLMNAILGEHIDLASTSSMSHDPIVDGGGTPIAFAAAERMDMFPDVPTMKELGVDQVMEVGRVMVVPTGVPDEVRDTLTDALDAISTNEEMIDTFLEADLPYNYLGYDDINEKVETSNKQFQEVIDNNADQF